jgi:hypothetical protein
MLPPLSIHGWRIGWVSVIVPGTGARAARTELNRTISLPSGGYAINSESVRLTRPTNAGSVGLIATARKFCPPV